MFVLLTSTLTFSHGAPSYTDWNMGCAQASLSVQVACPQLASSFDGYTYDGAFPEDLDSLCGDPVCVETLQTLVQECADEVDEETLGFISTLCSGDCDSTEASLCVERCSVCTEDDSTVDSTGNPCDTCFLCLSYLHCITDEEKKKDKDDPCFPGDVTVTKDTGQVVRIDSLKAGDAILAVTHDGRRVVDRVSPLSIVNASGSDLLAIRTSGISAAPWDAMRPPGVKRDAWNAMRPSGNGRLHLTASHRVATGDLCCDRLVAAANLSRGDVLWMDAGDRIVPATVSNVATERRKTSLYSPVLERGSLPLVNAMVTSPLTWFEMHAMRHLGGLVHIHPALVHVARLALPHRLPTLDDVA